MHKRDKCVDSLFINAIHWPTTNRMGKSIDSTSVLRDILQILESTASYSPGFVVWKELISACSKGASKNPSQWSLVRSAFKGLSSSHPEFWPDHSLLRIGLEAGEAVPDPHIAADLICRLIAHESGRYGRSEDKSSLYSDSRDAQVPYSDNALSFAASFASCGAVQGEKYSLNRPSLNPSRILSQDIVKAMEICVRSDDMSSAKRILESARTASELIPHASWRALYTLVLKGYANEGKPQSAEHILSAMRSSGIHPR